MIVVLAGGVGGARMAQGLQRALPHGDLTAVVNTADDFSLYGLHISPDLDTVMYTLAGIADPVNGWGVAGDTRKTLDAIAGYKRDPWFLLGDRDFATHILRTERLQQGAPLSAATAELAGALGVPTAILPMTDDPVATEIRAAEGWLDFQTYFVGRRQADDVLEVRFAGIEAARANPAALAAIAAAELVILAPSNPIVSIGPLLATPGLRVALAETTAPVVAVSPIIGGQALKGPAANMLRTLGHEVSALGVARIYGDLIDGLVIDHADAELAPAIEALGTRVLATNSIMGDPEDRERFAREVLGFAGSLQPERAAR
ncbi:MAG: 2-phospho-L-lactate transferase [Thermomicrobiales bacterium]